MTFGKKERMVAVIVLIAGLAAAIHFLVFQKKAQTYEQTSQEYTAAVQELGNAEFITDEAAFAEYKNRTTQYTGLVTSVVEELNLEKLHLDESLTTGAVDQWASSTIALLNQLNAQRNGRVRLTFLDQNGWNLSPTLPAVGGSGALADRVSQLNQLHQQLRFSPDVTAQYQAISRYNAGLSALGINPQAVSLFYFPQYQLFFNNQTWLEQVLRQGNMSQQGDLSQYYNIYYGLLRFGQAVPALHKIWMYNLIRQQLAVEDPSMTRLDANSLHYFGEALDVGIPIKQDEPLNSINKQLQALLDIIEIAGRTGIQEISTVRMMRPTNVAKATLYEPGATPAPSPTPAGTPDPYAGMMGMDMMMLEGMDMGMGGGGITAQATITPVPDDQAVGKAAGLELFLRGDNASLTRFFYELSHITRTYGLDDLYIYNDGQPGGLLTTATIEVITDVNLTGGAAAAPVEGAPVP